MALYEVTFTHRISQHPQDKVPRGYQIPDGAFSDKASLGKALRECGIIAKGTRLNSFRVEGDKVLAFPARGWHCVTLKHVEVP
jgi:hypothetical protein